MRDFIFINVVRLFDSHLLKLSTFEDVKKKKNLDNLASGIFKPKLFKIKFESLDNTCGED